MGDSQLWEILETLDIVNETVISSNIPVTIFHNLK